MALNTNKNLKLYYSIKEVSQMFNVSESLLRYWETEFPTLRPKTTSSKVRQYSDADIRQVRNIDNLVKVRGFKIAAARRTPTAIRRLPCHAVCDDEAGKATEAGTKPGTYKRQRQRQQ